MPWYRKRLAMDVQGGNPTEFLERVPSRRRQRLDNVQGKRPRLATMTVAVRKRRGLHGDR